ncbi:DUF2345 domain-containing protein [Bosea sp. F3-2]|uniref:DUF2345 domain-containing protein n=1 Tax=Bosea sp. F3-2 TaxID=2599640 RepID=UPI0011ED7142|nr:DUF2345 domain-containing protein [Bosea sp. F3-2]QEL23102.1 DUF2345 domain-containing protein [Bosea sp. F3-2]
MADADVDSLQRRIAALEAQIALLTQAISVDRAGNITISAASRLTIQSGGPCAIQAGSTLALSVGSNMSLAVAGRLQIAGGQGIALDTRYFTLNATVNLELASAKTLAIKAEREMNVVAGKALTATSADTTLLRSGDARLNLKKDGTAELHGRDITIQASGRFTAKASSDLVLKGPRILQN